MAAECCAVLCIYIWVSIINCSAMMLLALLSGIYIFATSQLFPHSQLQWYFAKIISEGACFDKFKVLASLSLCKGSLLCTNSSINQHCSLC